MIFLIGKIFIYMFLAMFIGIAAGWLLRNLQAQRNEESAARAMHDAKSKLPQIESLLRGRDEQITKLKEHLQEAKTSFAEHDQDLRTVQQKLREQERLAKRWQQSAEAKSAGANDLVDLDAAAVDSSDNNALVDEVDEGETNVLIAELSSEISRLKGELEQAQSHPSDDETLLSVEVESLRAQLERAESKLAIATTDLTDEQNKVGELERERELQNKSLQVLHQQLELERTRRVANG